MAESESRNRVDVARAVAARAVATRAAVVRGAVVASSVRAWSATLARFAASGAPALLLFAFAGTPAYAATQADAQQELELRDVVKDAINSAECFTDKFDSAVWYKLMEPKLTRYVKNHDDRVDILKTVYCETHRAGAAHLPPGLVLAVLDVESHFNRWAVSNAGAIGLMQVMPYWPEQLGMKRRQLLDVDSNIRMGCAILRHYLDAEHNDVRRALARYNGSIGHREYPDLVIVRWTSRWNGADDLGVPARKPS